MITNRKILTFNVIFIAYISNLCPVFKINEKNKFEEFVNKIKSFFTFYPNNYLDITKIQSIRDFFLHKVFFPDKFISSEQILFEYCRDIFEFTLHMTPPEELELELKDMKTIAEFFLRKKTLTIYFKSDICNEIMKNIQPQIVSQFILTSHAVKIVDKAKKNLEKQISITDSKNNELFIKKSEIVILREICGNNEKIIIEKDKKIDDLNNSIIPLRKQIDELKKQIQAKQERKQRLKDAKDKIERLKSIDPVAFNIESMESEINEYKELLKNEPICSITFNPLTTIIKENGKVKVVPCCGHIFKSDILDQWLSSKSTCPCCRQRIHRDRIILLKN